MADIEAWEKIPRTTNKPDGSYILRFDDTAIGIDVYSHGYVVGTIAKRKDGCGLRDCSYPSDLLGLVRCIKARTTRLDGVVCKGVEEAIQATTRVSSGLLALFKKIESLHAE